MIHRQRRMIERRIKAAKFPTTKSLDNFEFKAISGLNKMQALELVRCNSIGRRENVIALGLGLAAFHEGLSVGFITAASLVRELHEAHDERRLLRLQKLMENYMHDHRLAGLCATEQDRCRTPV